MPTAKAWIIPVSYTHLDTLDYFATPFGERPNAYGKIVFSMHYFYNELYLLALSHDEVVHGKKTIIDKPVSYTHLDVYKRQTKLRKELREAGVDYMVVKNTMLRLAVKGTRCV